MKKILTSSIPRARSHDNKNPREQQQRRPACSYVTSRRYESFVATYGKARVFVDVHGASAGCMFFFNERRVIWDLVWGFFLINGWSGC